MGEALNEYFNPDKDEKNGNRKDDGVEVQAVLSFNLQPNLGNMVLKIFKAVWFLSVLTVLANLLYIYAGMQQEDIIIQEMESGSVKISRELFFYCSLVIVALVNFMVYLTSKAFAKQEAFRTWFHGLIITVNIFFIITFSLIGTYNSSEVFDYSRIGFAIYGSVILVILWAASWPFYRIFKSLTSKQAV
jgi:hypothetical protein